MSKKVNQFCKVLIIDDDVIACENLAALLKSDYYEVYIFNNGKDALEQAVKIKPDIILLDVMMPEIDGFEVCQRLRENPILCNIPIIMITALDDRESKLRGIEIGADDYISKPYDRLELRMRIKTIAKLNRFRILLEERERFDEILQISPHGIVIINKKNMIEHSNKKFCQLLKLSPEVSLEGNLFDSFVHPDIRSKFQEKLVELDQIPQEILKLETLLITASGEFLPVEIIIGHHLGQSKNGYQLNIRDLSYEKNMASELHILMKAVQQSQIMFMIVNLDWKITFCNSQSCQKMGYNEKELIGTNFINYYPYDLNQSFHDQIQVLRKEKKEWKGNLFCVNKQGVLIKEIATISPLTDSSGFVTHFIKISEESTK